MLDPIYIVLIVIFVVIFLATAVLTLCALPGWIKIPDNYLKVLFSSLILEVIATVFVVFNAVKPDNHKYEDGLRWVALNEEGVVFQYDTSKWGMDLKTFSKRASNSASYRLVKKDGKYLVMSDTNCIGKIENSFLKDSLNLFNDINLKEESFKTITYSKEEGSGWQLPPDESLPEEWSLRIVVESSGYTISDINTRIYKKTGTFDKYQRKLHSFKGSDGAFYLVRISGANNSNASIQNFITFIIIRAKIEPKLN